MKKNKKGPVSDKSENKSGKETKSDRKKVEHEMEKLNIITDKIFSYVLPDKKSK